MASLMFLGVLAFFASPGYTYGIPSKHLLSTKTAVENSDGQVVINQDVFNCHGDPSLCEQVKKLKGIFGLFYNVSADAYKDMPVKEDSAKIQEWRDRNKAILLRNFTESFEAGSPLFSSFISLLKRSMLGDYNEPAIFNYTVHEDERNKFREFAREESEELQASGNKSNELLAAIKNVLYELWARFLTAIRKLVSNIKESNHLEELSAAFVELRNSWSVASEKIRSFNQKKAGTLVVSSLNAMKELSQIGGQSDSGVKASVKAYVDSKHKNITETVDNFKNSLVEVIDRMFEKMSQIAMEFKRHSETENNISKRSDTPTFMDYVWRLKDLIELACGEFMYQMETGMLWTNGLMYPYQQPPVETEFPLLPPPGERRKRSVSQAGSAYTKLADVPSHDVALSSTGEAIVLASIANLFVPLFDD